MTDTALPVAASSATRTPTTAPARPTQPPVAAATRQAQPPQSLTPQTRSTLDDVLALQASSDKQRLAKSFRMRNTVSPSANAPMTEETVVVACPDRWHLTRSQAGQKQELIRVGKQGWIKERGSNWVEVPEGLGSGSPCFDEQHLIDPANVDPSQVDPVARFLAVTTLPILRRTHLQDVEGTPCQEWTAQLPPQAFVGWRAPRLSVCLELATSLPRQVVFLDGVSPRMTSLIYDWNVPVTIEKPGEGVI